jgi:mannose-6-phosphate isomerase-like protein (cupin superfamily)
MRLVIFVALAVAVMPCVGQAKPAAQVFPARDMESQWMSLAQATKTTGSSGAVLGDYSSHSIRLSMRTTSGGAEVHAHYDDIFVVTQGKATLITGGTVEDAQTGSDGETKGRAIRNGQSQTIGKDDIVHIPAGMPHQLIIAHGDVFSTIVVKVKE